MVFTAEQIQQYKDKYKQVYEITVEDKSCLVRKPNRKDLSYVSTQKDPIRMSEVMLNQIWLEGDEEIRTDDELFLAVVKKIDEISQKALSDAEVDVVGMEGFLFLSTLLEYYLGIAPDDLPDEVWAWKLRYVKDIRELEAKANKG